MLGSETGFSSVNSAFTGASCQQQKSGMLLKIRNQLHERLSTEQERNKVTIS